MQQDLIFAQIVGQAQHERLALCIGADLPHEITGLPSRADLARGLAQQHGLKDGPLAQVAEQVAAAGSLTSYMPFLKQALSTAGRPPQLFHTRIVEAVQHYRLKTIITTAYDDLLEGALRQAKVAFTVVITDRDLAWVQPGPLLIIKLYGDVQRPESLVVTNRDRNELFIDPERLQTLTRIKSVFLDHTWLFLGHNLRDPDFPFIFQQIAANQFARTAYAVWPGLDAAELTLWRGQCLEVLDRDPFGIGGGPVAPTASAATSSPPRASTSSPATINVNPLPPPPEALPKINAPGVQLAPPEISLIQHVYGLDDLYEEILVEKEFGGGFSGTRVLRTLPKRHSGKRSARNVVKLGPADQLRAENERYKKYVQPDLSTCSAHIAALYEEAGQAALIYHFVSSAHGYDLGEAATLEEYYQTHTHTEINKILNKLLGQQVGTIWYGQNDPLPCFFIDEYGKHIVAREQLAQIASEAFGKPVTIIEDTVQLPDVPGLFPNPLMEYEQVLKQTLQGRKSYVHGDLHLRNILIDGSGLGWLIDFARVTERHNLYDFIKLETHVRTWGLTQTQDAFSLAEYVAFEEALTAATLTNKPGPLPKNGGLAKAYHVILTIRKIARNYVEHKPSFAREYLPALCLYCLGTLKGYTPQNPRRTQLAFATTCVLSQAIKHPERKTSGARPQSKGSLSNSGLPEAAVSATSTTHVSGGVTVASEQTELGGAVVGRDKIADQSKHGDVHNIFSAGTNNSTLEPRLPGSTSQANNADILSAGAPPRPTSRSDTDRHQRNPTGRQLKFAIILAVVILCAAVVGLARFAPFLLPPTARITYPVANSQVAQFTTVTGEYSPNLTDDLWVFVQERSGQFFPATTFLHQEKDDCKVEGVIKRDGAWEMPAILGDSNSVDQPLNIILATASLTVSQSISTLQRNFCLAKSFPGIEKLPDGLTVLQWSMITRGPDIGGPLPAVLDAQLPVTGKVFDLNMADQSEVSQTTWMTGTQTGIQGDLWVLVYVYNGRWYPQSILPCLGEAVRTEGDKWWTKLSFGGPDDIGRPFDILVVQTDADANRFFANVQMAGCKANYYQGLRTLQLPKGIAVMSRLRVYRQ